MSDEEFTDVFIDSSDNKSISNINNISNNESDVNINSSNNNLGNELMNTNIFLKDTNIQNIEIEANNRITKPKLTKYEKVRIIGERSKQLVMGAKPMIKIDDTTLSSHDIAQLEYDNNIIPFKIKRPLPNGTYEIWKFSELQNI